jgi:hypothetical protein
MCAVLGTQDLYMPLIRRTGAPSLKAQMKGRGQEAAVAPTKRPTYKCGPLVVKETTLLPRAAVAKGGPVPALVRRGRWALPMWLLLVAAATADGAIVDMGYYHNFATRCFGLTGMKDSSLRSVVTRALKILIDLRLVEIVSISHGRTVVRLLDLLGHGDPYAMPRREDTKLVYVPTGHLFANGWHRARIDGRGLDHVEFDALLIALTEESWQYKKFGPHEWEKSRPAIARDYGIAASTWSKGKTGLLSKGLLHWDMPQLVPGSRRLRIPSNRYTVDAAPLSLKPEEAARYVAVPLPVTITSKTTGKKLRLHRQWRLKVGKDIPATAVPANVVRIPSIHSRRRGA